MFGFLFLIAFGIYWLVCVAPCMWAANRLKKRVGGEAEFAKFAVFGCTSAIFALFLAVYLGPLSEGHADSATLMFKHLFGLHTLLLLCIMFFSAILSGATGRSGGFFYGIGFSSIIWFFFIFLQSLLPLKLTH